MKSSRRPKFRNANRTAKSDETLTIVKMTKKLKRNSITVNWKLTITKLMLYQFYKTKIPNINSMSKYS